MEIKELSRNVLDKLKKGEHEGIIEYISKFFEDDKSLIKALRDIQIQLKNIGGGYPPVGKQIETIDEIIRYTDAATKFVLEKGDKLSAGVLFHNQASFCFPNMDDGVDEKLVEPGYYAAVKDYELRIEIGDKVPILWAKWLVGIAEFIKGDADKALEILEETIKSAQEDPIDRNVETWTKLMIAKFYFKKYPNKRALAIELIEEVKEVFNAEMDKYGLETLETIIRTYF